MNIQWTEGLSVHDPQIDKQHQMYFDLLNRICAEKEKGASKDKLIRLILEFIQFVRFHFMVEENLMLELDYSNYNMHKMAHSYALDTLKTKLFGFEKDTGEVKFDDILNFAVEWFLLHVSEQDKKLGKFLASTN